MAESDTDNELRAIANALGGKKDWSTKDYLAMAAVFYKDTFQALDDTPGNGWQDIDIANSNTGYDALALWHEASKALVIVNRGAERGFLSKDFIEGYKAVLNTDEVEPLEESIDLALDWIRWCRNNKDLQQVRITGHSWGGALTDSLSMLIPAALGAAAPPVRGVGFASAGFARAVASLAGRRGWTIDSSNAANIDHFIRWNDPIRLALAKWFGKVTPLGSIWVESRITKLKGPDQIVRTAMPGVNHDRRYYYRYFDQLAADHHLFIDLDGDETLKAGRGPTG